MVKRVSVYEITLNPQFCTQQDYEMLDNLGFNVVWMDNNGEDSVEMVTVWTDDGGITLWKTDKQKLYSGQ